MAKTLKEEVRDYYYGNEDYFDEAFETVMKTTPTTRAKVEHTCDIDKDDLFGGIDKVIEYLKSLKARGYRTIEERWGGYEDNHFVAVKNEFENDHEYYRRLAVLAFSASEDISKREFEKAKKEKRIKELEVELKRLKRL